MPIVAQIAGAFAAAGERAVGGRPMRRPQFAHAPLDPASFALSKRHVRGPREEQVKSIAAPALRV
jgi:hypothetical protein